MLSWSVVDTADGFIQIYDWDEFVLQPGNVNSLKFQVDLCFGYLPCSITMNGNKSGQIYRIDEGSLRCFASSGCTRISFNSVTFVCVGNTSHPVIKIQGSELTIRNSSFTGCFSDTDGGLIQSYDGSFINIYDSYFASLHAAGFGGAIGVVGSSLNIVNSHFHNCSSINGGGAIWATDYECYGSENKGKSILYINSSNFQECSSRGLGGAVMTNGQFVVSAIMNSRFDKCNSETNGGALSINSLSVLSLFHSFFTNNSAEGTGGGALHVQNASLFFSISSCKLLPESSTFRGNTALRGGGGVLFWQDSVFPLPINDRQNCHIHCEEENFAVCGSCLASNYKFIEILNVPKTVYAGLEFSFLVIKRDAYNQTIASDSSSLLQVYPFLDGGPTSDQLFAILGTSAVQLKSGEALITIAIKPTFSEISTHDGNVSIRSMPSIYLKGGDSQTNPNSVMKSRIFQIAPSVGRNSCPRGYVLSLDNMNGVNVSGMCELCKPGTYSLDPLAAAPGYLMNGPACLNCPAGGNCIKGGCTVEFSIGTWIISDGMYVLTSCPANYKLLNSTPTGTFSHDEQMCSPCLPGQYIVNPNTDDCQPCPKGAVCSSDLSCALRNPPSFQCPSSNFVIVGRWVANLLDGTYVLDDCPPGFSLQSTKKAGSADLQECKQCLPGQYIIDPDTNDCETCPLGDFSQS